MRWQNCCDVAVDAQVPQTEIASLYDRLSRFYDLWGHLTESHARRRSLELGGFQDGQAVLEVAVGTGLAFEQIVRRNPHGTNVGIDFSPGMLARAESRLQRSGERNYVLRTGTAFALPVDDGAVDVLINNYMFDLLTEGDMDRVLREFRRALKDGGRLVLVNMTVGETVGARLFGWLSVAFPRLMGGCRGVRLSDRLSAHGFEVATREYHQQLLFPSEVIIASK